MNKKQLYQIQLSPEKAKKKWIDKLLPIHHTV